MDTALFEEIHIERRTMKKSEEVYEKKQKKNLNWNGLRDVLVKQSLSLIFARDFCVRQDTGGKEYFVYFDRR